MVAEWRDGERRLTRAWMPAPTSRDRGGHAYARGPGFPLAARLAGERLGARLRFRFDELVRRLEPERRRLRGRWRRVLLGGWASRRLKRRLARRLGRRRPLSLRRRILLRVRHGRMPCRRLLPRAAAERRRKPATPGVQVPPDPTELRPDAELRVRRLCSRRELWRAGLRGRRRR